MGGGDFSMIDFDCYGYCVLCHKHLLKTISVDGKLVDYFSGEKSDMEMKLNDGSKMVVTICFPCKDSYLPERDNSKIMKSVVKGWEMETSQLVEDKTKPDWTQERKENHMKVYSQKEIV